MNKTISNNKSCTKKILLRISLISLGALALLIIGYLVSIPLFDRFDHDRFITLDTQIQTIFQRLKTASDVTDEWEYIKACTAELAGDWPTGHYFCSATISMEKTATSVSEVSALQSKYYPIIDNSSLLEKVTELTPELSNDFGKNFVVSSAEKHYTEIKSGVKCDYLIKLYQSIEDANLISDSYGSKIDNGTGNIRISLSCTDKARNNWYSIDK
jgi:hypothetical protein